MSAESLSLISGTILSLAFSYIPGAKGWYSQFTPEIKRLIMLGLILISSAAAFGLSCLGWGPDLGISITCSRSGLLGLIQQIVIAIIANQSIYAISPHRSRNAASLTVDADPLENSPGNGIL